MKLVSTTPVKTTTGHDVAAGVEFDEPDEARAAFWLQTRACVKPGTKEADIAKRAGAEGVPFDLASGAVSVDALLSGRVGIDGLDLAKLREERGVKPPPRPDDKLPPVPPVDGDDK